MPMEKHVVEKKMEEEVSLSTVLDVIHDIHLQKCKCTFERICATLRQQDKDVSTHAVAALLEKAVTEKVVKKRVANNISSYQMLGSFKHGRQKLAAIEPSSFVISQLSDALVSTLDDAGSTDSKRSLSLKCIEQKISSEGKIHVPEDFDLSHNIVIVCKQLVSQGVLRQQGTRYHLILGSGHSKLSVSCSDPEVITEPGGITRRQKQNRVRFTRLAANTEDRAVSNRSCNDSKLVSGNYRVIGEVYASEMTCKRKAVVKRMTRSSLRRAQAVGLKKNLGQMPRHLFDRKNLRSRKYQWHSSKEQTVVAAVKPSNYQRKLLKGCKQYSNLGSKQHKSKDKTSFEDTDRLSTFSARKLKQSSESRCQNTSEVVEPDKSYDNGKRRSVRARRSIQNIRLSHADDAVATSVTGSLSSVGQPVVTLCCVESQPINNDNRSIPADSNSNANTENNGREVSDDHGGSLESTRNILPYQLASASELCRNTFNEVKKTSLFSSWYLVTVYR